MSRSIVPFTHGAHHLRGACHAWLVPDGGWGLSNAGLVVGNGQSLLIDTLVDLPRTAEMLEGFSSITGAAPIRTLFNTHGNGDHWFGNQLVEGAEIIASAAAAAEMSPHGPEELKEWTNFPGKAGRFCHHILEPFDLTGIVPTPPTKTFETELTLDVGGVEVILRKLGPAHTSGDAVAIVPKDRVLYAGDLLFINGTPIAWAELSLWIEACEQLLELDVDIVVPGHGPATDKQGIADVRDYLAYVRSESRSRWEAGMDPVAAADDIKLGRFGELINSGRLIVNVVASYREFDPTMALPDGNAIWSHIAENEKWPDLHSHDH